MTLITTSSGPKTRVAYFETELILGLGGMVATLVSAFGAVWYQQRGERKRKSELLPPSVNQVAAPAAPPGVPVVMTHLEQVQKRGYLVVGAVLHPPLSEFSVRSSAESFSGYYVELAKAVAVQEKLGVRFECVDWSEICGVFESREVDLVVSVFDTRARSNYADFVAPFHAISICGLTLLSAPEFSDLKALCDSDLVIAVTRGEAGWELVQDMKISRHRLVVIESSDLSALVAQVERGVADIAIVDEVTAVGAVRNHPHLKAVMTERPAAVSRNAIMVPKGDVEFANWVDDAFTRARDSNAELVEFERRILSDWSGLIRRYR